ncbi:MAG: metal ABC transporter substrate-binding protein [Kiritimatiellae bacterium]|nr:metal ABC transporter substrate-binding protein [Kiritimatiellia bacterium]MDW8457596.1 metal ABC transporter substrate-binding protein [Verrucomicrobiota bacterium]
MYQLVIALVAAAVALTPASRADAQSSGLRIVATTPILADVAKVIAGDRANVETLFPADADPHAFEPGPRDAARLARADLVVVNGLGLEIFLEKFLEAGKVDPGRLVVASEGRVPRTASDDPEGHGEACEHDHEHGHEHPHEHGPVDPHVWLDPEWVAHWARRLAESFAARDPAAAAGYTSRCEQFVEALAELDKEIRSLFEPIPAEKRVLVTDHNTFGYFAERYGVRVIGHILPNISTISEISARDLAALQNAMREAGARVIVAEETENPALAQRVAEDVGAHLVLVRTHTLGPPGSGTDSYIGLMRTLAERLAKAWQADRP